MTIALVIAVALGMILFMILSGEQSENLQVQVWKDGELIHEYPLNTDMETTVRGSYTNRIIIRDGQVAITESDCPGEDCVHSGWISKSGRSIICLPNRVEIRIAGGKSEEDDVDAVVK